MRQEYIITQVYHKAFFERYRKSKPDMMGFAGMVWNFDDTCCDLA